MEQKEVGYLPKLHATIAPMGTSCLAGQSGGIQKVHCSVITTDKFSSPEVFRTPLDYEGEPAGRKVSGQVQLDLSLSCNQKGMVYSAIGPALPSR